MPVVFVIAPDWKLRAMVRAELRERGIEALGLPGASEAGAQIASGTLPAAVVLEASGAVEPGLDSLARRVPFVVVASGVGTQVWPRPSRVLRRPVRIAEIVDAVIDVLRAGPG